MPAPGRASDGRPPGILYVLAGYPRPSETFIRREVEALARRGVRLLLYTLAEAAPPPGSPPVVACADWSRRRVVAAVARSAATRPAATLRALVGLAGGWRRPIYLLKALRHCLRAFPLAALVERRGLDWIHAHFADLPTEVALFLHRLTGRPMSFSAHARDVFVAPVRLEEKCRRAVVVFACSRAAMRALPEKRRIRLVHHGLDLTDPLWSEIYAARRRRTLEGTPRARPARLLAVGRFVPKKGFHVLLAALEELRLRGVEFECKLLGGGPERPRLERAVIERGLAGRVELLDFQPRDVLAREWRRSDLLVHPAVVAEDGDRDGIPNGILEAMACGLPVVASDLPSIREVLADGVNGFLTPPGDPEALAVRLAEALDHDRTALAEMMEEASLGIRRDYDVETNVGAMLDCWKLLQRHGQGVQDANPAL